MILKIFTENPNHIQFGSVMEVLNPDVPWHTCTSIGPEMDVIRTSVRVWLDVRWTADECPLVALEMQAEVFGMA